MWRAPVSRKIDSCSIGQLGLNVSRSERLGGKMQEYPQMRVLHVKLHMYFMDLYGHFVLESKLVDVPQKGYFRCMNR